MRAFLGMIPDLVARWVLICFLGHSPSQLLDWEYLSSAFTYSCFALVHLCFSWLMRCSVVIGRFPGWGSFDNFSFFLTLFIWYLSKIYNLWYRVRSCIAPSPLIGGKISLLRWSLVGFTHSGYFATHWAGSVIPSHM